MSIQMTTRQPAVLTPPEVNLTPAAKDDIAERVTTFDIAPADGLDRLWEKSSEIQSLCTDHLIQRANLLSFAVESTIADGICAKFIDTDETGRKMSEDIHKLRFTDHALTQICGKLGIPVRYMQSCQKAQNTELVQENFNTWIEDYNKSLFIRAYDDTVRGVLSDRYSVFDTPDILDVVQSSTRGMDLRVKQYFMSPERLHIRLIGNDFMNIPDEDLFAGIQIDSSDVGRAILSVRFFIFKQVCTNGLCVSRGSGVLFEQKHLSINRKEFADGLTASLKSFPKIVAEYEDAVTTARKVAHLFGIVPQRVPNFRPKDDEIARMIDKVKTLTRLPDESAAKVVDLATQKYGVSDWGFINATTEVAQQFTLERRIELERIAGSMLSRYTA